MVPIERTLIQEIAAVDGGCWVIGLAVGMFDGDGGFGYWWWWMLRYLVLMVDAEWLVQQLGCLVDGGFACKMVGGGGGGC